jgi:hypothetical protein
MKRLTSLAVIALLLLACSAAFGQGGVTLGLKGHNGRQYCDYLNFSYGTTLASGIDVARRCPGNDGTMIGVPTNGSTAHLSGPVVMLADSVADAQCNCYSGEQYMWLTKTKASSTDFGWERYYNDYDAFKEHLQDWGYLTTHLGP